jgi:hypothetical protein
MANGFLPPAHPDFPQGRANAVSTAIAAFGRLDLSIYADTSGLQGFRIDSSAEFKDTLTITDHTGSGFVQYVLRGEHPINWDHAEQVWLNNSFFLWEDGILDIRFATPIRTPSFPFIGGVPFDISLLYLISAVSIGGDSIQAFVPFTDEPKRNTIYLDSIFVFDSNMNPLTGFTLTAASGTEYAAPGKVPEPASILTLTTVLALVEVLRRRRSHSSGGDIR